MATRAQIEQKAYKCLDEVYPDTPLSSDIEEFRVEDFVDDAIRFVGRVVPVRALGEGKDFKTSDTKQKDSVSLPDGFIRLIAFQMSDWALPVVDALYSDNPRYRQQANPILKGTPSRPIVFICNDNTLEYFSSGETATITKAQAFVVDDSIDYPEQLSEAIAWKTAELVLSAMNDVQGLQFVQAQLKQLLEVL